MSIIFINKVMYFFVNFHKSINKNSLRTMKFSDRQLFSGLTGFFAALS